MIVHDLQQIGNKLYEVRRRRGLSRLEVAEYAGLSDRTYADIERGSVNMRIKTLLNICQALSITPDELLTETPPVPLDTEALHKRLAACSDKEQQTTMKLLAAYLDSLQK
ncbi:MAG: helix-turn-helix transcriptional regulator [Clostridia bacterium]|nr:helix-turn-helix transcriptional regulator [Clostridia bacterium]